MAQFLYLQNTVDVPPAIAAPPDGHDIEVIDQYELHEGSLVTADGLLLCQHLDEAHLQSQRDVLDAFLGLGGAIAVNGPIARPFLSILSSYEPVGEGHAADWILELGASHSITAGIEADHLTRRRGVIGFWARGTVMPPPGAIVLSYFKQSRLPADWVWTSDGGGRLFFHPGNNFWGYAADTTSAAKLYPQLLDWMTSK
ncbi:hypothetical protein [Pontivivens ytuae]|uniref:Uncharacterized protein n=1 Tax=Pontivivens ytuae TaxID=2789856 RepID=A0A7S9LV02_9RHOB|nr:hypothetical protein [Pontivivens ytuae]QPH55609.1 hypothetical protein I0K15_07715 [Pontivivens ytuae]